MKGILILASVLVVALATGAVRSLLSPPLPTPGLGPQGDGSEGMVDVGVQAGIVEPIVSGGPEKRQIRETMGQGACWLDFDHDGDLDLFLPNGAHAYRPNYAANDPLLEPWRFYVSDGGRFVDRAQAVGADLSGWGVGCAVGDVDGDGWDDLYVTTATGPNRLLRNTGHGTFEDATEPSGTGAMAFSAGAVFADLDGDRDLDLFVATYLDESKPPPGPCRWKGTEVACGPKGYPELEDLLYLNDGRGVFTAAPEAAGIAGHRGFGLSVLSLDADSDGDTDLFVANDSSPNRLFLNRGDATFEEAGLVAGVALSHSGATQAGMGSDAGDVDGDGLEDLVVTNFSDDVHNLYRRQGPGLFDDTADSSGLAQASFFHLGWSAILEDFDLDGDLDLFLANGHVYPGVEGFDPNTSYRQPLQLLWNDGRGHFTEDATRLGAAFARPEAARGAAPADFDGDGDVDLLVVRDGAPPLLLRNDLPAPDHHWLKIRLVGDVAANPQGLGAQVVVEAGGRRQVRELRRTRGYLSGGPAELIFGLGKNNEAAFVRVLWPGAGGETRCEKLEADHTWVLLESGSCRKAGLGREINDATRTGPGTKGAQALP